MSKIQQYYLRKQYKKRYQEANNSEAWLARLGDGNGNVVVPTNTNYRYVRPIGSSQVLTVHKGAASDIEDAYVWVGRHSYRKDVLTILSLDPVINQGVSGLEAHADTHYQDGADPIFITDKQITPLLVYPTTGMTVKVNPGWMTYQGQPIHVASTTIDLTSNIPDAGAQYSLVRVSSAGAVSIQDGTPVDSLADLSAADIPECEAEYAALAFVRLYFGQTALSKLITAPDVKMLVWGGGLFDAGTSTGTTVGPHIFIASQNGAVLDTDLSTGGGTDDTAAIQAILNHASDGTPIWLIMDGPALISGINVYSNTTIQCLEGAGFYLDDDSNRAIIRNANRSRTTITDEHISLIGGFYNGNNTNQTGIGGGSSQEADNTFMSALQFFGVNYLIIRNVVIYHALAFGCNLGNVNRFEVINYECTSDSNTRNTTDGMHVNGPASYGFLHDLRIKVGDAACTLNAGDDSTVDMTDPEEENYNIQGPYVGQGPITDILVDGLQWDESLWGFGLLSHDSNSRIDRITVKNVSGRILEAAFYMGPYNVGDGDFGSIVLENWNITPEYWVTGNPYLFWLEGVADSVIMRNITVYNPTDGRPLIRLRPTAIWNSWEIDGFSILDEDTEGETTNMIPIKWEGYVRRFKLSRANIQRIGVPDLIDSFIQMDNAASDVISMVLNGVMVNMVKYIVNQTAGCASLDDVIASQIAHFDADTWEYESFKFSAIIPKLIVSNWDGYQVLDGTATEQSGDAFTVSPFNDGEGDPAAVDETTAADGTSDYSARRDHRHKLGTVNLNDLDDVDTTGTGTGDVIYNSGSGWVDYPLGIGSKITVDGNKLRFGNVNTGNYIDIDITSGNLRLIGDATAWDDLRISGSSVRLGATAPTLGAFGPSGNLRALHFDSAQHDEIHFEVQMPHNWKAGSNIHPHVHWAPVSATAGNVVWELEYAWANINGIFGTPGNMASAATAAGGTAWVHKMTELLEGGNEYIDGTGKTISSMLVCRLHRNAGTGSDTLAADVAFLECDFHYEIDSFGSDEELIKDASASLLLESGDYFLLESGDNLLNE